MARRAYGSFIARATTPPWSSTPMATTLRRSAIWFSMVIPPAHSSFSLSGQANGCSPNPIEVIPVLRVGPILGLLADDSFTARGVLCHLLF